jgi:hypothetical protein
MQQVHSIRPAFHVTLRVVTPVSADYQSRQAPEDSVARSENAARSQASFGLTRCTNIDLFDHSDWPLRVARTLSILGTGGYRLKALGLIFFATYIAFCVTLYFAGNEKDFSDPFVPVAPIAANVTPANATPTNTSPPRPGPVATPDAGQPTNRTSAKRAAGSTDKPASSASKSEAVKPK